MWTMAAEELPAESRGLGFGLLALALGTGFVDSVVDPSRRGSSWRSTPSPSHPLLFVAYRRRLPESRGCRPPATSPVAERWQEILRPGVRRWLLLVVATTYPAAAGDLRHQLALDFLQEDRGMSASTANLTGRRRPASRSWCGRGTFRPLRRRLVGVVRAPPRARLRCRGASCGSARSRTVAAPRRRRRRGPRGACPTRDRGSPACSVARRRLGRAARLASAGHRSRR